VAGGPDAVITDRSRRGDPTPTALVEENLADRAIRVSGVGYQHLVLVEGQWIREPRKLLCFLGIHHPIGRTR
jgi:hypothetical protein